VTGEESNMFAKKKVTWEVVRNIANNLTNGLDGHPDLDPEKAHLSWFSGGPQREVVFTESGEENHDWIGPTEEGWGDPRFDGWIVLGEEDAEKIIWRSGSGVKLVVAKTEEGWTLEFIPSPDRPDYRGRYFQFYDQPELVENWESFDYAAYCAAQAKDPASRHYRRPVE